MTEISLSHMTNLEISFHETDRKGIIRMVVMETDAGVKSVKDIFEGDIKGLLTSQLKLMEIDAKFKIIKKGIFR